MIRSATNVITTATKIVEAMANQRLAVRSIDFVRVGERDGLVGDLGEHAVERGDQDVDGEAAR